MAPQLHLPSRSQPLTQRLPSLVRWVVCTFIDLNCLQRPLNVLLRYRLSLTASVVKCLFMVLFTDADSPEIEFVGCFNVNEEIVKGTFMLGTLDMGLWQTSYSAYCDSVFACT